MKAVTLQGKRKISVEEVPDPQIQEPTDAIVRITSTAICGSDLHLYEVMTPFMEKGDLIGHEPMGIIEEVGSAIKNVKPVSVKKASQKPIESDNCFSITDSCLSSRDSGEQFPLL